LRQLSTVVLIATAEGEYAEPGFVSVQIGRSLKNINLSSEPLTATHAGEYRAIQQANEIKLMCRQRLIQYLACVKLDEH
jgi:hypothetical protein